MTSNADRPSPDTRQSPARSGFTQQHLIYTGVVVLVAGLIGAALIYVFSPDYPSDDSAMAMANRRSYEFQIERIGGMATVYAVRLNEWLSGLWHGKRLGVTVGVLAIVVALGCFWVAGLMPGSSPKDSDEDRIH